MTKEQNLLNQAQEIARTVDNWADLFNALFDPLVGILAMAYPSRSERQAFIRTPEYAEIRKLISDARDRFGMWEGAMPKRRIGLLADVPPDDGQSAVVLKLPRTLCQTLDLRRKLSVYRFTS